MIKQNTELNFYERNVHKLNHKANFMLSVVAETEGKIDDDILKKALRKVQGKFYYMNVYIRGGKKPKFIFDANLWIPLRIVERKSANSWIAEAEKETLIKFDKENEPLARAVLVKGAEKNELILSFNHVVSDGVSCVIFLKDVVETYAQIARRAKPFLKWPDSETFLNLKEQAPREVAGIRGAWKFLPFVWDFASSRLFASKKHFPGPDYIEIPERTVRIHQHILSKEETSRLIERCKKENTTAQGALDACAILTLACAIRNMEGVETPVIENLSRINMRKHCRTRIPDEQLGLWVGHVMRLYKVGEETSFWELAVKTRDTLRKCVKRGDIFHLFTLMGLNPYDKPEEVLKMMEAKTPYVEVSNIGKIPLPETRGVLEVKSMHFTTGLDTSQASKWGITVNVTNFNDQMTLNFHYLKSAWTKEETERMTQSFIKLLLENIHE